MRFPSLLTSALTAALFASPAAAFVQTFDVGSEFSEGDTVTSVTFGTGGPTATVTTTGGLGTAVIFDSDPPIFAPDSDLEVNSGNILIIPITNPPPNDSAGGGTITFDFGTQAVNLLSFSVIDQESNEGISVQNGLGFETPEFINGDSQITTASLGSEFMNITEFTFVFDGSGAIDNIEVQAVPLPAPVVLLGAALFGFGFAGWRKQRSAV